MILLAQYAFQLFVSALVKVVGTEPLLRVSDGVRQRRLIQLLLPLRATRVVQRLKFPRLFPSLK